MAQEWSSPQILKDGAQPPLEITSASIVPGAHGEVYVFGRGPNLETDTSLYVEVPFVAFKLDPQGRATRLKAPPFAGDFAAPHGGMVNDTLHVFWGEADSTAPIPKLRKQYADYVPVVRGIWTSSYVKDTWSPPKFVATRFNTNWLLSNGWADSDRSPIVSLALVGIRSRGGWTIGWLNAKGDSVMPEIAFDAPPLYVTLVSPAPSHLVLGYIANDRSVPNDHNSVFTMRSTDGGRSWGNAVRIALSGQQIARDITILQTPDGRLHTLWLRNTTGTTFGGRRIGYAVSRDTGQTWSTPEYWDPGEGVLAFKAVTDAHNGIHLVYQTSLPDGVWPTLAYTSRSGRSASWTKPKRIFGDTASGRMPELTRTASGDVMLLFAKRISKKGRLGEFVSAIAYLRDGRSCMPIILNDK